MSLVDKLEIKQNSQRTALVLTYQVGDIAKCLIYQESFGKRDGYHGELGVAIADSITMLRLLCEQENLVFEGCLQEGEERFLERQLEIQRKTR